MVKKSGSTKSAIPTVVPAKKDRGLPLAVTLQTVEVIQCSMERKIPRPSAVKGKISTELSLSMEIVDRNDIKSLVGLLKAEFSGHTVGPEPSEESFVASFLLEGLFYVEEKSVKISEKHLDKAMANRVIQEMHPLCMLRASELLSMMGYSNVKLKYGISKSKLAQ